jgi:hypothetical protein
MKTYKQFVAEMMTTQSSSDKPGFSTDSDDIGPVAGRSPKMFFLARKFVKLYGDKKTNSKKIWLDNINSK